jgi:hypothetical protein
LSSGIDRLGLQVYNLPTMPNTLNLGRTAVLAVVAGALAIAALSTMTAQGPAQGVPRFADGHANLSGIWQANNTANWDLLTHQARQGPMTALGAAFSVPGGLGVVEGDDIPYKPEARAKKDQNAGNWLTADPEIKCFLPGVPRATYMPYPFQIVQGGAATDMLITYEFASASRIVRMNTNVESPVDTWMGWSRGRWDGDTLVVDVTAFNGESWFDRAGNYQTSSLHVVERYTPVSRDVLQYEATIEDAQIYTRPWKISMPLYRRLEKNAQLVEYKCVEFAEEVMYGHLVKGR